MTKIIGISGSLRKQSYNTALLHAAASLMPPDAELLVKTINGIPLYNEDDEETNGIPEAVTNLKEAIASADAILIATPEYNGSVPGVLKNAIDWLSRPSEDISRIFGGRPIAIIGASPGGFGTILAQNAWLPTLRALGTNPWFGDRLLASKAPNLFDESGTLKDEAMKAQLQKFMSNFVKFIQSAG